MSEKFNLEKFDIKLLKEKLQTLRGLDFEAAETQERLSGNPAADISFTRAFQVRLAAMALGVNVHDLKSLPLPKYNQVANEVSRFLFSSSIEEIVLNSSEQSQ